MAETFKNTLMGETPESQVINVRALSAVEKDYQMYCMRTCWLAIPGAQMVLSDGQMVSVTSSEMRALACEISERFNDVALSCLHKSGQLAHAILERSLLVAPKDARCYTVAMCHLGVLHLQPDQPAYYNPRVAKRHLRRAAMSAESFGAGPSLRARIYSNISAACTALGATREAMEAQEMAARAKRQLKSRNLIAGGAPAAASGATDRTSMKQEVEAAGCPLPDDNMMKVYSRKFNERIDNILGTETLKKGTWSTLFKDIDHDHSGLITFDELKSGVRERLKISVKDLSELELKALWVALDTDDSGFIEATEFQKFMNRDAPPPLNREQRSQMLMLKRQNTRSLNEELAKRELELDGLKGAQTTKEMKAEIEAAGQVVPADEELVQLAVWWAKKVAVFKPGVHRGVAWLQVFKEVGNDSSGLITFDELKYVVRQNFKLTKADFSDLKLKQLWCAVDTDESDSIAQVEFSRFIKLAKDFDVGGSVKQMKFA